MFVVQKEPLKSTKLPMSVIIGPLARRHLNGGMVARFVVTAVRSKAVVLLLLTFCLLLPPLWESVTDLCFVVCYFMSILVLQSS